MIREESLWGISETETKWTYKKRIGKVTVKYEALKTDYPTAESFKQYLKDNKIIGGE